MINEKKVTILQLRYLFHRVARDAVDFKTAFANLFDERRNRICQFVKRTNVCRDTINVESSETYSRYDKFRHFRITLAARIACKKSRIKDRTRARSFSTRYAREGMAIGVRFSRIIATLHFVRTDTTLQYLCEDIFAILVRRHNFAIFVRRQLRNTCAKTTPRYQGVVYLCNTLVNLM